MNISGKNAPLITISIVFVIITIVIIVVLFNIGKTYRKGLLNIVNQPSPQANLLIKRKEIRKITIQKNDNKSCIEVTRDGVVRVYDSCQGSLTDAVRLNDSRNILKLFKVLSETDLASYQLGEGESLYTIIIETDEGTQSITVVIGNDIAKLIEDIEEDIPNPSASPLFSSVPNALPSSLPVSSLFPGSSLTPSASPGQEEAQEIPFKCNFSETAENKPYRVSGVVCSEEPQ